MKKILLDEMAGQAVVMGGAVLGGGGGGLIQSGLEYSKLAVSVGTPTLITIDELEPDDLVVTVSGVGSPAATEQYFMPVDCVSAIELLQQKMDKPIVGIISSENGPGNGVNGWIQSAILKIPVVDAPANGRAHPTGLMGAMGAHRIEGYRSIQAAVGGNPETGKYLEMLVEGQLEITANLVRQAAVEAGGAVMVARDPLPVSYVKENAAPGAITQAMEIGRAMMAAKEQGAQAVIDSIIESTGGSIFCTGTVKGLKLTTIGGYDVGSLTVAGDHCAALTFWNEFMTLEGEGARHATFPDLITLISLDTGVPIMSAEVRDGDRIAVLTVPRNKLILGKGVLLSETLREAEVAVRRQLIAHSCH